MKMLFLVFGLVALILFSGCTLQDNKTNGDLNGTILENAEPAKNQTTGNAQMDSYLEQLKEIEQNEITLVSNYLTDLNDSKRDNLSDEKFCELLAKTKREYLANYEQLIELGEPPTTNLFIFEAIGKITSRIKEDREKNMENEFGLADEFCVDRTTLNKSKLGRYASYTSNQQHGPEFNLMDNYNNIYLYYELKKQPIEKRSIGESVVKDGFEIKLVSVTPNVLESLGYEVHKREDFSDSEWTEIEEYYKAIDNAKTNYICESYECQSLLDELESKYGQFDRKLQVVCEFTKDTSNYSPSQQDEIWGTTQIYILDDLNDKMYSSGSGSQGPADRPHTRRVETIFDNKITEIIHPIYVLCNVKPINGPVLPNSYELSKRDIYSFQVGDYVAIFTINPSELNSGN